jgi:hypothetical protein
MGIVIQKVSHFSMHLATNVGPISHFKANSKISIKHIL